MLSFPIEPSPLKESATFFKSVSTDTTSLIPYVTVVDVRNAIRQRQTPFFTDFHCLSLEFSTLSKVSLRVLRKGITAKFCSFSYLHASNQTVMIFLSFSELISYHGHQCSFSCSPSTENSN